MVQVRRVELLAPTALAIVLGVLSVYLHFQDNTMLMHSDKMWVDGMAMHRQYYPFSVRLFTTSAVQFLNSVFGVSFQVAFGVVQYSLFVALALVFYRFLRIIGFDRLLSNLGVAMLLSAYPILCAFFEPVYTWDDLWQYVATVLAFSLIAQGKCLWAAVVLSLGALAREATLILYPVYVYALLANHPPTKRTLVLSSLIPLIVYGVFAALTYQTPEPERFHQFRRNFVNAAWAANAAYSLIISFGYLWVTSFLSLVRYGTTIFTQRRLSFLVVGASFAVPATIVLTFLTTFARETRLFFPPFVFIIPLSLWMIREKSATLQWFYRWGRGVPAIIMLALATWFGIWAARILFPSFDYRSEQHFSQVFLGIQIAIAILIMIPLIVSLTRSMSRVSDDCRQTHAG